MFVIVTVCIELLYVSMYTVRQKRGNQFSFACIFLILDKLVNFFTY